MTISELERTLPQMSSSVFNGLDIAQQSAMIQVRKTISREMDDFCVPNCFHTQGYHFWSDLFYTHTSQDTLGEGTGYNSRPRGAVIGFDYVWNPAVYTGMAYGYTYDTLIWRESEGTAHSNSAYAALYAGGAQHNFYVQGSLLGALTWEKATRNVYFSGVDFNATTLNAHHSNGGWEMLGNLELGFFTDTALNLSPYALADYMYSYRSPFTETGGGTGIDLFVHRHGTDLLRIETGMELSTCWKMRHTQWMPHITFGAVFEKRFMGRQSQASFVGSSCVMDVAGLLPNRTLFLFDGGLIGSMIEERLYFLANYQGEWGRSYYDSTVSLELKIGF
jgi:uncharacterized protein with beta-barrel porin domain